MNNNRVRVRSNGAECEDDYQCSPLSECVSNICKKIVEPPSPKRWDNLTTGQKAMEIFLAGQKPGPALGKKRKKKHTAKKKKKKQKKKSSRIRRRKD